MKIGITIEDGDNFDDVSTFVSSHLADEVTVSATDLDKYHPVIKASGFEHAENVKTGQRLFARFARRRSGQS